MSILKSLLFVILLFFLCGCTDNQSILQNSNNTGDRILQNLDYNGSKSSLKNILSYSLTGQIEPGAINTGNHNIMIEVVQGTDLAHLTPQITISDHATISPASGTEVDFSSGIATYTVTAEDNSTQDWQIYVNVETSSSPEILSFSLFEQTRKAIMGANTIEIEVANGTNLSMLRPLIAVTDGATISPASLEAVDFSSGYVNYTVTSKNSIAAIWKVVIRYELYEADNVNYQYTGRIDFTDFKLPKFWSSGVYIETKFTGSICDVEIVNQRRTARSNYLEFVVDGTITRMPTTDYKNIFRVAEGLTDTEHTLLICKDTEASIGYLGFIGIRAKSIGSPDSRPSRKIEFIGDSITCGYAMDISGTPCNTVDNEKAYLSYGPITARALNAQWHLTSRSGIGLLHCSSDNIIAMPKVWDKININDINSDTWDYTQYVPDVIIICLGQNDEIHDSMAFCSAYISFILDIRARHTSVQIVCLTSPMGDFTSTAALKTCINDVVAYMHDNGDTKVSSYFFKQCYNNGCGSHPGFYDHQAIAAELEEYLETLMVW